MFRYACIVGLVSMFAVGCIRPQEPNVLYIAFGDSSTGQYPDQLVGLLGIQLNEMAKEDKGGEPSGDGLDRLQELVDWNTFPNTEHFMYWQGGNDLLDWLEKHDPLLLFSPTSESYPFWSQLNTEFDRIQVNVEKAIQLSQDQGWQVYAATYMPLQSGVECPTMPWNTLTSGQANRANEYLELLNQRIRLAIQSKGACLVDIGTDTDIPLRQNYLNCNHLNERGNLIVAERFLEVITNGP